MSERCERISSQPPQIRLCRCILLVLHTGKVDPLQQLAGDFTDLQELWEKPRNSYAVLVAAILGEKDFGNKQANDTWWEVLEAL